MAENQFPLTEQLHTLKIPGVVLILGAGGNVGTVTHGICSWSQSTERLALWHAVALKFYDEGYQVAVASRSQSDPNEGKALPLKVYVIKESDIVSTFNQVKKSFGAVIVYNGALFGYTQISNQLTLILFNSSNVKPSISCRRPVFPTILRVFD